MGFLLVLTKKLRNLQLQTQLILFSSLTIIIITIIGYLIFVLQIQLVNIIYKRAAKDAAQKQIWDQMVILQQRQVILMETFQISIQEQMTNINKLIYLNLSNYEMNLGDSSYNSENEQIIWSYNISNQFQSLTYKDFPDYYLVYEWFPLIFNYDQIINVDQMFWFEQNLNIFTYYNISNAELSKFQNFSDQIWYYNWVSQYQNFDDQQQAKQLITFQPVIMCNKLTNILADPSFFSFSIGMFDGCGEQVGVIASQFKIEEFQMKQLQFQLTTIGEQYFLTKDGNYISEQNGEYVLANIYNETLTGYDAEDWEAIKKNDLQNSNCQHSGVKSMLCRFNKKFQMDTIISCNSVLNGQYYVVSIALSEQYVEYVDDVFQVLLDLIQAYQQLFLIINCCVVPIVLVIIIISIKQITKPLNFMRIDMILTIVKQKNLDKIYNFEQKDSFMLNKQQKQIKLLMQAYGNLINTHKNQNKINNEECLYFQNLKYKSNRNENFYQLKNIKKGIQIIPKQETYDVSVFIEALKVFKYK